MVSFLLHLQLLALLCRPESMSMRATTSHDENRLGESADIARLLENLRVTMLLASPCSAFTAGNPWPTGVQLEFLANAGLNRVHHPKATSKSHNQEADKSAEKRLSDLAVLMYDPSKNQIVKGDDSKTGAAWNFVRKRKKKAAKTNVQGAGLVDRAVLMYQLLKGKRTNRNKPKNARDADIQLYYPSKAKHAKGRDRGRGAPWGTNRESKRGSARRGPAWGMHRESKKESAKNTEQAPGVVDSPFIRGLVERKLPLYDPSKDKIIETEDSKAERIELVQDFVAWLSKQLGDEGQAKWIGRFKTWPGWLVSLIKTSAVLKVVNKANPRLRKQLETLIMMRVVDREVEAAIDVRSLFADFLDSEETSE